MIQVKGTFITKTAVPFDGFEQMAVSILHCLDTWEEHEQKHQKVKFLLVLRLNLCPNDSDY